MMPIPIFGVDFTSSPSQRKPIAVARCGFSRTILKVLDCLTLPSFSAFEAFFQQPGPWVAACDFPFGQPLELVEHLRWPRTWQGYVSHVAALGKERFTSSLTEYMADQPVGKKLRLRVIDKIAGARSPMMLYRVPVGKMFFEGAPRLLASGVSIAPCYPRADTRVVVEGYPALVARRWLGKRAYKSDERKKQTEAQMQARYDLIDALRSSELDAVYGVQLSLPDELAAQLVREPMADRLDAVLCAIQAAWAYQLREHPHTPYGIPPDPTILTEGWITDPATLKAYEATALRE